MVQKWNACMTYPSCMTGFSINRFPITKYKNQTNLSPSCPFSHASKHQQSTSMAHKMDLIFSLSACTSASHFCKLYGSRHSIWEEEIKKKEEATHNYN